MSEGDERKPTLLGPYHGSHDPPFCPAWIGRGAMEVTPIRDPSSDFIRELAGLKPSKLQLLHLQQGRDALYPTPVNNPVTTVTLSRVNSIRTWLSAVRPPSPNDSPQLHEPETHETGDV